jgi:putative FmdB family regulatory protein
VPLYEYECSKCKNRFEKIESVSSPTVKKCPKCGGRSKRLVSRSAIQFKGSGWYVSDYAKKSGSGGAAPEAAREAGDANAEAKTEGKAEGKTEGATDSKPAEATKSSKESDTRKKGRGSKS